MSDDLLAAAQTAILLGARLVPPVMSTVELWLRDDDDDEAELLVVGRLEQVWRDRQGALYIAVAGDRLGSTQLARQVNSVNVLLPTGLPYGWHLPLDQWPRIDP